MLISRQKCSLNLTSRITVCFYKQSKKSFNSPLYRKQVHRVKDPVKLKNVHVFLQDGFILMLKSYKYTYSNAHHHIPPIY